MQLDLLRVPGAGTELATLVYHARRPLVAAHGYSSSKQNLDPLCSFLAGHGCTVYSFDFPGHRLGASGGALRDVDDVFAAMRAVVARARSEGAQTLYTMGHSMGAVTALCTAADDPTVAGAISLATGWGRLQALDAMQARGVTDLRAAYVVGAPLRELAAAWQPRLEAALPKLSGRPVLYVAAERDAMVARTSVQELYDRAPEPKELASIDSDHTFAADRSRAVVLQWIDARHAREPLAPR